MTASATPPVQKNAEQEIEKPPSNEIVDGDPDLYFSNRLLERPSLPVSGPDPYTFLQGTDLPELPIRLRLFIDTKGTVRKIDILPPELIAAERLTPVKEMFRQTRFIPGSIRETKIPSYVDIEMELKDFRR